MEVFQSITDFFTSPFFTLLKNLIGLFIIFLWISLIYWTYRDAKKRGVSGVYWAAVTLFFNVFGWLIYLIVRPPEYLEDARERALEIKAKEALLASSLFYCPSCLRPVEKDFLLCPHCLKKLKKACSNCGRAIKMNWTVCPYCRTNLGDDAGG